MIKLNETDFVGSPMTARWLTEAEKAEAAKKQGAGGNGGSKQPNGNASRHSPSSNVNRYELLHRIMSEKHLNWPNENNFRLLYLDR